MSDLTERARVEAERRWPREGRPTTNAGNPLTPKGWLDEGMASGFVVGAAWAAEQGAETIAGLRGEVEWLRERERTLIRVKDADLDDLRHEVEARDALVTNIAKIAASAEARVRAVEAVASEHWDWKAGRSLHAAIRAALATPEPTVQAWPGDDE